MSTSSRVYVDLSAEALIDQAVQRHEGILAANQALAVTTGTRTGRSPKDKFIVQEEETRNTVDWGGINQPILDTQFQALWQRAKEYLCTVDHFEGHLQVGADATHYLPIRIVTEYAWHQLFVQQLFIRPGDFYGTSGKPEWTLLSVPGCNTDPKRDGVHSDCSLLIHISERKVLLCGFRYAGEMKKALFSILNYLLPDSDVLPMHCSANVGIYGDVALFFGLSGTGKTTLSADPSRALIGDDEHGWSPKGVFNFEGGCYAKCIDLSKTGEPAIWNAIRFGAVMENVVLDPKTLTPDYTDASLTQNTRAAYPRDFINPRVPENRVTCQPQTVIFLTCDLYGVLPPIARLTQTQAVYYFLSGYTALVGSTEVGQTEPIKTTFSACFGAPFFPRSADIYATLLRKRLQQSQATVYLINTGWYGGTYGSGKRFPLSVTRNIVKAALSGSLRAATYTTLTRFQLAIPEHLPGVDDQLLDPKLSWTDVEKYQETSTVLIQQFINNFKKFSALDLDIQAAGPMLAT